MKRKLDHFYGSERIVCLESHNGGEQSTQEGEMICYPLLSIKQRQQLLIK